MKPFACRCGRPVYFDNHHCGHCGRALAFDPATLTMQAENEPGSGLAFCAQRDREPHCNWLAPEGGNCRSCRTSQVIPALSKSVNRRRWRSLEYAKRLLIYDLLRLGLPVDPDHLAFVFKEDRRTNPAVADEHVAIGHQDGVITINAAEADEVFREQMRQAMNERVRTLVGHFRHESGHYYDGLLLGTPWSAETRALFGDESADYAAALERHYRDGPPVDWNRRYISAYAAAHPREDWAECWAHYLHVQAALEAGRARGWVKDEEDWLWAFVDLAIGLNEGVRSFGLPDAYPFVITDAVAAKLRYIDAAVDRVRTAPS